MQCWFSMDSSAGKRQKQCDIVNEDRISNLPDFVLCHILSFLPTRCSVQTSILSRRWRFMWTSVPVLYLDDTPFRYLRKRRRTESAWVNSFKKFANKVLALYSHPRVHILRLKVSNSDTASHVASYISTAISQNVEEIIITGSVHLPVNLFSCGTLSVLKLRFSVIELNAAESVWMPSLKVFHIHYRPGSQMCAFSINRLLCGAPVLEELVIYSRNINKDQNVSIVSSSLKTLEFQFSGTNYNINKNNPVVIDAPKLEFLDIIAEGFDIELKNTPSILKATIISTEFCSLRGIQKVPGNLWTIVNIKFLRLSIYMLKDPLVYELVHFANLKKLVLRYCGEEDLSILPQILERLPCLEHLILEKYCCLHKITWKGLEVEKSEISCLKYSLKRLEVGGFSCHKGEMGVLKYFMQNSSMLNEIKLTRSYSSERQEEIFFLKKLLTFPRCSNALRIIVF